MTPAKKRFLAEAAVIVAVAAGAGLAHLGAPVIAIAVGVAWLIVGAIEYRAARDRP